MDTKKVGTQIAHLRKEKWTVSRKTDSEKRDLLL